MARNLVLNPGGGVIANITQIPGRAHADLQALNADDHAQYALLAGRQGDVMNWKSPASLGATYTAQLLDGGATVTLTSGGGVRGLTVAGTYIIDNATPNANPLLVFSNSAIIQLTVAASNLQAVVSYNHNPTIQNPNNVVFTGGVGGPSIAYRSFPNYADATPASASTVTGHTGFQARGFVGTGWQFTNAANPWIGYEAVQPGGTGTINRIVAYQVNDMGARAANEAISLYSIGASAQMRHVGAIVVGADAAPSGVSVGLEVNSVLLAFLASRMTTVQKNALTAIKGMIVYDTTTDTFEGFQGAGAGAWAPM